MGHSERLGGHGRARGKSMTESRVIMSGRAVDISSSVTRGIIRPSGRRIVVALFSMTLPLAYRQTAASNMFTSRPSTQVVDGLLYIDFKMCHQWSYKKILMTSTAAYEQKRELAHPNI